MSIIGYIERKRLIVDSLVENLYPVIDEDLINYIPGVLDSSYDPFTTTFMKNCEALSVDELIGFLLYEESRLKHEHLCVASVP